MEKVGRDKHDNIARDQIEKIGRDHHLEIDGKEAIKIVGIALRLQVTGDVIEVFQGNQSTQVTQNLYIKGMQIVIEAMTGLTIKHGRQLHHASTPSGIDDLRHADGADQQRRFGALRQRGLGGFTAVPDGSRRGRYR